MNDPKVSAAKQALANLNAERKTITDRQATDAARLVVIDAQAAALAPLIPAEPEPKPDTKAAK